jgi:hypothetical protein
VPKSQTPRWKKLYVEAIRAHKKSQKLIDQARKAILDRTVEIVENTAAANRERRELEEALRQLWKVENVRSR